MSITRNLLFAGLLAAASFAVAPAYALTAKECSVKYQAAKDAGTLGGLKWNDFRKAECATDAAPAAETKKSATKAKTATSTAANDDDAGDGLTMKECSTKYQAAKDAGTLGGQKWNDFRKSQCSAGATTAAAKPAKPAKSSASDDDGDGLTMKECSAKYQAAKSAGTLGGQKWNDFRKAECGSGATAAAAKPAKTATAPADDSDGTGLSMKECGAKYQAAKSAGTLGGLKWNDFRKAQCSGDNVAASADDDDAPAPDKATYNGEPAQPTTAAPRGVTFPKAIATKYSTESAGKARMHTCLDQYYANKERNSLGGLKWIQKGGGYYSLCNTRLKS